MEENIMRLYMMRQTSHKRHLANVNGIVQNAGGNWISLHCRRCGHILLFRKYYHLNISEQSELL